MSTESKTTQLITKLIRETSNGNVEWTVKDAPRALNYETEQSVPLYLQTEYKGRKLGVYDLRTKYFTDEDEYHWIEGVGFCIVDDKGRVVWEANESSLALGDLFKTAREQASGVDDILDDLLEM
ncbi:hypothetical protein [Arenicella chitinivorans]|nr:hypothetical protein [Arenicella chitinivorans]